MNRAMKRAGMTAFACWLTWLGTPESRAGVTLQYDTTSSAFSAPTITEVIGSGTASLTNSDTITFKSSVLGSNGTLTVAYTPESFGPQSVSDGASAPLGTFSASTTGNFSGIIGATFDLTINQALPESGSGTAVGHLLGTVVFDSGNLYLNFGLTNSVSISVPATAPNVTYTLSNLALLNNLDALTLNTHGSPVNLNANVTFTNAGPSVTPTPEPSTMALADSGLGVAGVALARRRRRAEKSAR